jgi:hypothetical protein
MTRSIGIRGGVRSASVLERLADSLLRDDGLTAKDAKIAEKQPWESSFVIFVIFVLFAVNFSARDKRSRAKNVRHPGPGRSEFRP